MKKILGIILCLVAICALFAGCKSEEKATEESTDAPIEGIHFLGLKEAGVTAEEFAGAVGVDPSTVISTELGSGEELLILNDVIYNTILYKQVQCINYGDKTVITLTYTPDSEEEFDGAVDGILQSLDGDFGVPGSTSTTGEGFNAYTWRNTEINDNYIFFYPLTEEEFKLSFYLY